ncbi:hypothetical protein ACFQX7_23760 [Luedemannella flava]|uniref:hypothetical protein n=1 Tax=Luedemannella flava TaxID=349316 RepID=UPI0031D91657
MSGVRQQSPEKVVLDFGAGPRPIHVSTRVLNLRRDADLAPATGPVDWSQLDALPDLLTVEWSGPDRGIIEAVAARPGVQFLYWLDAVGDVDLTPTRLDTVRLGGPDLGRIHLPDTVRTLLLKRPPAHLTVEAPDGGRRIDVRFFHYGSDVVIPAGLRRAATLWLRVGDTVSARVLSPLTDLANLTLTFDDPPGTLTEPADLDRHAGLHTLRLDSAYGLDPHALPDLPALRNLKLNGTRRRTARALKARFKGTLVTVDVRGAKTEEWLAEHMFNPFRDWVDESKAFGTAACAAYNRARAAADAVADDDPDRLAALEVALRGLVTDLNAIDDRYELIDTINREHAWTIFHDMACELRVPPDLIDEWFDADRQF